MMSKVCCGLHQEYTLYFTYYKNVNYCYYYNYCVYPREAAASTTILSISAIVRYACTRAIPATIANNCH